jgi:hypothetical protein
LFISSPPRERELRLEDVPLGAGGINLPGGGGGGTRGTGGTPSHQERVTYIEVAPTPATVPAPSVKEPEVKKPPPTPRIEPPEVKPPDIVVPPPPVVETKVTTVATLGSIDSLHGRGGGSGNDGTSGNGPGSGGGIGGGVGPGRGNGTGPGNGGGPGTIYPPNVIGLNLLPEPPNKLRPLELVALFDVDTTGTVLAVQFKSTGDKGYDRKVQAALKELKFTPAVDWWGKPVRATGTVTFKR